MDPAMERMEAQLKRSGLRIDRLAAKTEKAGLNAGFEAHIYVDELKALHAIALAKFNDFKTGEATRRARLEAAMKRAWDDLDAALKRARP